MTEGWAIFFVGMAFAAIGTLIGYILRTFSKRIEELEAEGSLRGLQIQQLDKKVDRILKKLDFIDDEKKGR